jgi:hypothetical protein
MRVPDKRSGGIPLLNLPSVAHSQQVVDGWRAGQSVLDITRALVGTNEANVRHQVEHIVADVDNYDTYLDEVAIQRAYCGDRDAWVALTHYERRECVYRIISRASLNKTHVRWPGLPVHKDKSNVDGWLEEWAKAVGETPHRFQSLLTHRRGLGTAV